MFALLMMTTEDGRVNKLRVNLEGVSNISYGWIHFLAVKKFHDLVEKSAEKVMTPS